jgi:hypothetical protein
LLRKLRTPAWSYPGRQGQALRASNSGSGRDANPEATPIVVNGRMYLPAGKRVIAFF